MNDMLPMAPLQEWLEAHIAGFAGPLTVDTFGIGQSNPTFRLSTPQRDYVLRRKPAGELLPSAHAVDREYRVIGALHDAGFPVPRAYALCEDPSVIGSIFYVMELVEGRVLRDGRLPGMIPTERRQTYEALVDALASLHALDPHAIGLGDYGRPGNYYERQLARWSRQYRAGADRPVAAMETLMARLPASTPPLAAATIVHGDFRLDNLVLDSNAPRVRAVLDWELSTLGDPLADLGFLLISWVAPMHLTPNNSGFADQNPAQLGIPALEEMVARYAGARGIARVDAPEWYIAFNLFRLAAIYQGIAARAQAGNATGADAESYAGRIEPLARIALDLLA